MFEMSVLAIDHRVCDVLATVKLFKASSKSKAAWLIVERECNNKFVGIHACLSLLTLIDMGAQ